MSSILFVRHAQASLFADDYDQLSEHGQKQARLLGQYLADNGYAFDEIYLGPRQRHRQTAEIMMTSADQVGTLREIPELDEHQVDRLVTRHAEEIGEQHRHVAALQAAFTAASDFHERQRSFARLFEAVADLWVDDRWTASDVEPWRDFHARVNRGINCILQLEGRRRRIVVVASAGSVAGTLQRALGCSPQTALGLGWRLWNCSLTGVVFSADRFTLDYFNATPHLSREERTYR